MKKISEHTEHNNPVLNAVFIGVYLAALIMLLVFLARRVFPVFNNLMEGYINL